MFDFKIEERYVVPLEKDLAEFDKELNKQIPKALGVVGRQMVSSLAEHVNDDVYGAYKPRMYPSRAFKKRFGQGLHQQARDVDPEIDGNKLTFTFEPSGSHSGRMADILGYSDMSPHERTSATAPLKPNPVHGDDFIRRLETGAGYDWRAPADVGAFPKRPFWTNFVNDQVKDKIINYFMLGMKPYEVIGDGDDVTTDGSEYVEGTNVGLGLVSR